MRHDRDRVHKVEGILAIGQGRSEIVNTKISLWHMLLCPTDRLGIHITAEPRQSRLPRLEVHDYPPCTTAPIKHRSIIGQSFSQRSYPLRPLTTAPDVVRDVVSRSHAGGEANRRDWRGGWMPEPPKAAPESVDRTGNRLQDPLDGLGKSPRR